MPDDQLGFIDVTLRDGHQSLWATRMTTKMMLPILAEMDYAGFRTIDLIGGAVFDVCVRYLHENPWARMRAVRAAVRSTPLNIWTRGQSLFTFDVFPDDVVALAIQRAAANGMDRLTVMDGLNDLRNVELSVRVARAEGLQVVGVLVYSVSPVHTDEYYRAKARELVGMDFSAVCLKDPSGLLTPDRVRTLVPALRDVVAPLPLELHSHCLSGLAPICYLEAVRLGVSTVHTAISPLAHGASLPPTEWVARHVRGMGRSHSLRQKSLTDMAAYFSALARRAKFPVGRPAEYDPMLYEHQVPGGMVSNLANQLRELRIEDRLEEILEEAVRVRRDMGYIVMVSPFSQFVVTQATLNVLQGERYRTIPEQLRQYAAGYFGCPPAPLDQEFLDRALGGREIQKLRPGELLPPAVEKTRAERGPFNSDDELLLAVFYQAPQIAALQDGWHPATGWSSPLHWLLSELGGREDLRQFTLKGPNLILDCHFADGARAPSGGKHLLARHADLDQ